MTLLESWSDSLSLLKPKNLKLFLLVTLKSVIDAYKVLLKYWWWLFLIAIGCSIAMFLSDLSTYVFASKVMDWVFQIILFVTLLATRPSLEQKDYTYFRRYISQFWPIALMLLIMPKELWPMETSSLYFFTVLFISDSRKTVQEIFMASFRALKMFIYNAPLLIIIGLILALSQRIISHYIFLLRGSITLWQMSGVLDLIFIVLAPFTICLYTNIYIKKLHEQFDIYFKQPN